MNREIKFRVWDTKHSLFIDSGTPSNDGHGLTLDGHFSFCNENFFGSYQKDNRFIIQQYTGLKDKNGQDIYEGDILYHAQEKLHVLIKWNECGFVFVNEKHPDNDYFLTQIYSDEMVVRGNIFEEPYLLDE